MEERRRAIDGKLIEKSKSNPGYYKYQFTIKELDGSENIIPSYGVDMTDALNRILKKEKKEKLNKVYTRKVEPTLIFVVFFGWLSTILLSSIYHKHPEYAFYGTIGIMSFVTIYALNYFIKNFNN